VDEIEVLRDRYRGVMLGKAVGDALGATVEFMSRTEIRERYGVHREITGGGWLNLQPGDYTDDTQMAVCIARSIVALGRFDPADIANHFVAWYRSNPPDIGNTTRHALQQLDVGVCWDEAGRNTHQVMAPRDASNGSVMRCAPVALLARGDAALLARWSAESSLITHANPLCVAGCVALNAAIAALLDNPDADVIAAATLATDHGQVRDAIAAAPSICADDLKSGGYVLDTLQSSFWALTNHATFKDAVVAAVNLGDDADTTGAVTGALAGAKRGASAIPPRWLDVLRGGQELIALADGLLDLSLASGGVRLQS
jgi:ADP-ribosyl-[dinitrogen reductase] hydrolase